MSKQSFISGFLKQAQATGNLNKENFSELNKYAEAAYESYLSKEAVFGPAADLSALGLPSAVGAMIGSNYAPISDKELEQEMAYSEDPSISKALKYALIPGYTGYRAAKTNRLEHAYDKYRDMNRARLGGGVPQ